ncbi:MAG: MOSC domain-containing protein [Planctomycetota bacterium]|nr:MOSC domain-containing protein [Planctomycetota bacterium]
MASTQPQSIPATTDTLTEGRVEEIYIVPQRHVAPQRVSEVRLVPKCGVAGHKNFVPEGHKDPGKELTLIAREQLEWLRQNHGIDLHSNETRRNILTSGIDLNQLVGREFTIGSVRIKGIRLCQPCSDLVKYTSKEVLPGLVHRGGLRAGILTEGVIRPGDTIRAV